MSEKYVLPPDVVVRSAQGLPPELRSRLGLASDERVLMRPHSRDAAAVVDAETESLIEVFRTPHTIVEAVIAHSEAHALEPVAALRHFFPALRELVNGRVLVGAGSIHAAPIELSYQEGDLLAGFEILVPIHLAPDTEVYLARGAGGRFAALKVGRSGHEAAIRQRLALEARALTLIGAEVAPELLVDGARAEVPHLALAWRSGVDVDFAAGELRSNGGARHLVELVGNVLSAYARLHGLGVLHGDVSPRNVLADAAGEVALVDFGLARLPGDDTAPARGLDTTTDPESAAARLAGVAPRPTAAGEQYSLAAMAYALITGTERQQFAVEQDALVRQLAAPEVSPFADHDVVGLPAAEAVVRRALSRDPAARFDSVATFRDAFESAVVRDLSGNPPARRGEHDADGRRLADEVVARIVSRGHEAEIDDSPASAAIGAAGLAYGLLRLGMARDDEILLANADIWAGRAASSAADAPTGSLLEGAVGIHCVDVLVALARDDEGAARTAADSFARCAVTTGDAFDVLSGSAGGLIACSLLVDALTRAGLEGPRDLVLARGDELAAHLRQGVETDPDAAPFRALGAAHGTVGILYALLRWHESASRPLPTGIDGWLRTLADRALPEGRGLRWPCELGVPVGDRNLAASWCNGAAGYVSLWTLAERLLGEPSYGRFARGAGWTAWESPDTTGDLCCGLAGRAYAQLCLYRHTDDRAWLIRARRLAARAAHNVRGNLQPRDSLYHGELGVALLIADLELPDCGGMPLYEAEAGWPAA